MTPKAILFYDGNCALCHGAVRWVLKRKPLEYLYFSPLQGETAPSYLAPALLKDLNTVVLWRNEGVYTHASAVFHLWKDCGGGWKLLSLGRYFPSILTNAVYRFVARNRFRWKKPLEGCPLPDPAQRHRFLM